MHIPSSTPFWNIVRAWNTSELELDIRKFDSHKFGCAAKLRIDISVLI